MKRSVKRLKAESHSTIQEHQRRIVPMLHLIITGSYAAQTVPHSLCSINYASSMNYKIIFSLKIEPMQAEDVADDEETGSDEGFGPTLNENLFPNTFLTQNFLTPKS